METTPSLAMRGLSFIVDVIYFCCTLQRCMLHVFMFYCSCNIGFNDVLCDAVERTHSVHDFSAVGFHMPPGMLLLKDLQHQQLIYLYTLKPSNWNTTIKIKETTFNQRKA